MLRVGMQCRHLIPALNTARVFYTTERAIANQFPGHGFTDDLPIERSFDTQSTWVTDMLG